MAAPSSSVQALIDEASALIRHFRQSVVLLDRHMLAAEGRLLQLLDEYGPLSVPQIGRLRSTSRQNVQVLVNRLVQEGIVELVPNPAHKRSPLVRLTPAGKSLPPKLRAAESEVLDRLSALFGEEQLAAATALLAGLRTELQETAVVAVNRPVKQKVAAAPPIEDDIPISLL